MATVALAAKYHSPLLTLAGTTMGMLIANGLGIYVAVIAGKMIPQRVVKWVAAIIFIVFGYTGLYTSVPREYITLPAFLILTGVTVIAAWLISRGGRAGSPSRAL